MASSSDKLFKKRKAVTVNSLKRRPPTIEPRKRFLIVCEGEVTEINYFEGLKLHAKLSNLDIKVCGKECGSAPTSVVEYAKQRANREGHHSSGGYHDVFCVFDRDTHSDFEQAKSLVQDLNKPNSDLLAKRIKAICSYPCFEVWLLYHFKYTRKQFTAVGDRSSCDNVARELKAVNEAFADFNKALDNKMQKALFKNLETAIKNSYLAKTGVNRTGIKNPSTQMHCLVEYLLKSGEHTTQSEKIFKECFADHE